MLPPTELDEAATRKLIDEKLIAAGWTIQDKSRMNLYESLGVAVREMDTSTGPADYMLFIDGRACGILEAKREARRVMVKGRSIGREACQGHGAQQSLPLLCGTASERFRFSKQYGN